MKRAIVATVTGRVQGVGFRYSTQRVGASLNLDGWVKNQVDGTVRTWAQGEPDSVAQFISFLDTGPPAARVSNVSVADVPPDPTLGGFQVRY